MAQRSLWAEYREELTQTKFIEYEWGFISYILDFPLAPDAVYAEDIYVQPEFRRTGKGMQLVDELREVGRKAGKIRLVSSVRITFKGCEGSLAAHLAAGFAPTGLEGDRIWLARFID